MAVAQRPSSQADYISTVYGRSIPLQQPSLPHIASHEVLLHCLVTLLLAAVLVTTSILRNRLARFQQCGACLEGPVVRLWTLPSGHPGDYATWLTAGVAIVGWLFVLLLH